MKRKRSLTKRVRYLLTALKYMDNLLKSIYLQLKVLIALCSGRSGLQIQSI
jgi:hypothetical protein